MSRNLQNFAKLQKIQLENLVDFEKCCTTHIFLQRSVPIQPKTSNVLPKICLSAEVPHVEPEAAAEVRDAVGPLGAEEARERRRERRVVHVVPRGLCWLADSTI